MVYKNNDKEMSCSRCEVAATHYIQGNKNCYMCGNEIPLCSFHLRALQSEIFSVVNAKFITHKP
jgi:hypothetical protein